MTKPLTISASQLSTFTDCERKWWLSRVAKLPEVPKGYLTFGTVLHACLERWCSADENGRVPRPPDLPAPPEGFVGDGGIWTTGPLALQKEGNPVDPFPPGWETIEERGARVSVTPNEAALIRKLVEQAIERGIVQRGDGRVLERELRLPVIDGVELVGFVDCFLPDTTRYIAGEEQVVPEVHDHKTFGEGSVRFLKQADPASPNYLGKDDQLLTYAAATSILDDWDGPVLVRHNQFPKFSDPRGPRSVEAVVPPEVLAEHWAKVQAQAARLVQLAAVKRWDDVPASTDACSKYGGCPFREICGRVQTLDGYRARVERQLAGAAAPRPNVSTAPRKGPKEMTNDVFKNARARGAAPQPVQPQAPAANASPERTGVASTPAAAVQPVAINGGAPPPAAPVAPPVNAPPWANPACTACKGVGFNSKGRPCPICDALAKRLKRPTSSLYLLEGDALSGFTAAARPEKAEELAALGAPAEWSSKAIGTLAVSPAAPRATEPAATIAVVTSPADVEAQLSFTGNAVVAEVLERNAEAVQVIHGATPEECDRKATEAVAKQEAAGKRGRKPAGLSVYIGCAPLKGPDRPTETAQGLLQRLGAELAKDMGAASYWELDAFKRRDRIKQRSAEIAEGLGRTVLLVAGVRDPDVDSLVSSLLPHAEVVVEGLR